VIAAMHRSFGVVLRRGTPVTRLVGDDRVTDVELSTGERLDADLVAAALGVTPVATLFGR
jgi:3-phenylpropionate/trans-cinnamate dioxygenase ferredoxin reductase subunit